MTMMRRRRKMVQMECEWGMDDGGRTMMMMIMMLLMMMMIGEWSGVEWYSKK
jgi:hypothetical protein